MKKVLLASLFLLLTPVVTNAHNSEPITVQSLDKSVSFELPIDNTGGGASMVIADLGTDGTEEIIVANGLGNEPRVRVLRQDGSEIGSFLAFAPTMGVGLNLVVCDLTGDSQNEIIVAPMRGGGPHVRIFNSFGNAIDGGGFFAYAENFRGGVNLACGDVSGDSQNELVTLPAPGGGPHVRVWNFKNASAQLNNEFFAFDKSHRAGVLGVVKNNLLYVVEQHSNNPNRKTFSVKSNAREIHKSNLNLSTLGLTNIFFIKNDLHVSTTDGVIHNIKTNTSNTINNLQESFFVTSNGLSGKTFYVNSRQLFDEKNTTRILVDTKTQRLYAYKDGVLENTFLISSGYGNATPVGIHHILAKIPKVHYTWSYGENDPRNYDLGLVPYNLRIYPHIYLHYAYWHNNFGHKMSHGCVNVSLTDMKWLYEWTETGIEVEVK